MVLKYLIENRDHIVSRDELVDNLWPDQIISEGIINNCIMAVRRIIGDSRGGQETIRTLYGVGYRFVAEVEELNPGVALGGEGSFAPPPLFLEQESDINRVGAASVSLSPTSTSSPQNVLGGDYLFVTVACGGLEQINAQDENRGSEVKRRLRRVFFARAQEVAKEYEGGFRFFGSEGFLAIFGWPAFHEDHAQRAVRAGLKLQEDFCADTPLEASVRIGLHTGPMELTNRRDPLATFPLTASETTALAIRLQHLAKPGIILTSLGTLPLLQDGVEYVEHGSVYLPGQSGSTLAYRIVRPSL
jgi:DNA-binding winged helix-turn-helix (wHTH) protein/class 3 adenylate cyclase